jgi:hypothetical protein
MSNSDNKLRSNQFPYHLSGTHNKQAKSSFVNSGKYSLDQTPTTYMVVNFDNQFVDSIQSEKPLFLKVDEQKTKEMLAKLKKNSPDKKDSKFPTKPPYLSSSYVLPKKVDPKVEAERLMFRRADVGTQTDTNLDKIIFEGLSGYSSWTAEVVEPFLKDLRKEVKAKRPADLYAYIIRYCQAMQVGDAVPDTVDPLSEEIAQS